MKQFLLYILVLLTVTLTFMLLGEYAYSYVYKNGSYRNKVMWVRDSEALKQNYDYIILGNSRALYHIDPLQIEEKTGKIGLNLAINNSYPFEVKLMLLEFLKQATTKKLFVQVDYTYNVTQPDVQASVAWMPYIKDDSVYYQFPGEEKEYQYFKNIPFYRYTEFESELGFRNIALSLLGKQPDFLARNGFVSLQNRKLEVEPFSFTLENTINPHIDDIIAIAKETGIAIYFFTAPFLNSQGNLQIFENQLPNYTNFSKAIKGEEYFSDAIHLNENGANEFTRIFSETYFE